MVIRMRQQSIQEKIEAHFAKSPVRDYPKGTLLTLAGNEPDGVSLLLEGTVEQYSITTEGNRVTVNLFKPPAFFPMSWAINKTPNEYFFGALTPVKLRRANPEDTVWFLRENPDVTFDLLRRVYLGTDGMLKRLVVTASGVAMNRLIFELLIEGYRFGEPVDETHRRLKIRQSSLAAQSGLARETVSRELHKLEEKGLIQRNKPEMVIDIAGLNSLLELNI